MLLRQAPWLVLALCACGCGTTPVAGGGRDAMGDARAPDAGRDAPRDAGAPWRRDAGPDAGPQDAGPPDPAGWVPLPGLPDGCVIERAEHPEELLTVTWESCGDGCLELDRGADPNAAAHDGERGYFVTGVHRASRHDPRIVVLAATEGPPLAAWRGPPAEAPGVCQIGPVAVSASAAAFGIDVFSDSWGNITPIYHAPLSEIGAVTEPVAVLDESVLRGANLVQHLAVSETTVAGDVQPGGFVLVLEGGAMRHLGGALDPLVRGIPAHLHVVGTHVLWEDWLRPVRIASGSMSDDATIFYEAASADVLSMTTDGTTLAWMQGYDWLPAEGYGRVELWTAPYVRDSALLEPRKVRDLDGYTRAALGAGIYGIRRVSGGPQRAELYDLSDGRRRTFVMPDGVVLLFDPLYITPTEMLLIVSREGRARLWRVDITRLPYDGG